MSHGPGKYDDFCFDILRKTQADCVVVIVIKGNKGDGFSVNAISEDMIRNLPFLLEAAAKEVRDDLRINKIN